MPAMAPPERPPEDSCCCDVNVMFAPVATGVSNGMVVVGLRVVVTVERADDVGASGALAATTPTVVVVAPGVVYVE